jgi:hypothetical protein
MDIARFQGQKYLRQMHALRRDLQEWQRYYAAAAVSTTPDHLKGRFAARAVVLEDVIHQVQGVIDALYAMPRLS